MDDDNNTADALAVVFDLVRYANSEVPDGAPAALAKGVLDVLLELTDVLGLIVIRKEEDLDSEIVSLIEER